MPIRILADGQFKGAHGHTDVLKALAQSDCRRALKAAAVAVHTGTSGGNSAVMGDVAAFVNAANSGTSLAQKAATETAMGTVKDSLASLFERANLCAAALGITQKTYSGGGTPAAALVAVTVAITAATTGVQATEMNTFRVAVNNAYYQLAHLVNQIAGAVGVSKIAIGALAGVPGTAMGAIAAAGGTAADPGVTKVAVDAAFLQWANNSDAAMDKINAIIAAVAPLVICD